MRAGAPWGKRGRGVLTGWDSQAKPWEPLDDMVPGTAGVAGPKRQEEDGICEIPGTQDPCS